jgi:hypothetical protein
MGRKLLLPCKPILVLIILLFATLSTFGFKSAGISSPAFSPLITAVQQQSVKHAATTKSKRRYYKNVKGERVQSPAHSATIPAGACAVCMDGTYSFSRNHRGTCSHHGGVKKWLN